MSIRSDDRSVAELVSEASEQLSRLVRDEMRLAAAELKQKGKRAGIGAGLFGGAGLFALLSAGALTTSAILALSLVLAGWLAGRLAGRSPVAGDRRGRRACWQETGSSRDAAGARRSRGGRQIRYFRCAGRLSPMSDVPRKTEPTPDDVRRKVVKTRRELSDTVEALANKANVPARAKEKADEVRAVAKEKAAAVRDVAVEKAEEAKQAAVATAADVSEQTQKTARKAMDKLPEPVALRLQGFVDAVRERPVPFAVGAVMSFFVLRWVVRGRRA
jgi:putative superfamily III holin-X/uncharacterized protein DUF3618